MYGVPFCIGGVCVVIVPAVKRGDKQVRQIDGEPERILVIIIRDADDLRAGLPGLERVEDLLIGLSVAEGVCVTAGPDVDARVDLHAGILPRLFPRNSDRGEAERGICGIVPAGEAHRAVPEQILPQRGLQLYLQPCGGRRVPGEDMLVERHVLARRGHRVRADRRAARAYQRQREKYDQSLTHRRPPCRSVRQAPLRRGQTDS